MKGAITMIRRGLLALLSAATSVAGVYAAFDFGGIRLNASPSLPIGLYRTTSDSSGNLVEFCPAKPYATLFPRAWLSQKRELPRRS